MNFHWIKFYLKTLLCNLFSVKGTTAMLSAFGALWLLIQITTYFFQNISLQNYWWAFLMLGFAFACYICRPILNFSVKLRDRDTAIEIAIGNVFSFNGALIIGSNSTFDTHISNELISDKSIQGQFTRECYAHETQLDKELERELEGEQAEELDGKRLGKRKRYPIGTVAKLNPKDRIGYFLAIADINEHGVASSTFDNLKEALSRLWVFIGQRGQKGSLITPVLGSGFGRLTTPRQVIVQEIIKSFIAACSERLFCDKLTIVISESDVLRHQINFKALCSFLYHNCTYTEFAGNNTDRVGTAVPLGEE